MSIEKFVDEFMRSRNATPLEDFEGFSAIEMYQILHHPFGNQCPIILNSEIDSGILETSPILKILRHLFSESYNSGGIKSGGFKYGKSENIVNIRFVERFAKWFGFVESRERKNDQFRYQKEVKLRVTELLSNLLIIRRQQGIQKEHT